MHLRLSEPINSCRPMSANTVSPKRVKIMTSLSALTDSIKADTIVFSPGMTDMASSKVLKMSRIVSRQKLNNKKPFLSKLVRHEMP